MRKRIHRLSILLVVVGILCLIIGGFFALVALMQYEHERGRFFTLAAYFAGAGILSLLVRYLFIVLPDALKERRSGVVARRKELAKTYKRPVPSPPAQPEEMDRDGGILLVVLILLGLVSAAAMQAIVVARAAERETAAALKTERLRLAALDTARAAMARLADDPDLEVDHADEAWAEAREFTDPAGITRMVRVQDLNRAFDLNNLAVQRPGDIALPADEVAANILVFCGVFTPGEKIAALADWIDADADGRYEASRYADADPPSLVANRLLYGWDELFRVEGWTPDLFETRPAGTRRSLFDGDPVDSLTIIPSARNRMVPVNINTADPTVLQALFGIAGEGMVERMILRRKEQPYRETAFLVAMLGADAYRRIQPYIDVKSSFFQIDATAYEDGRSARLRMIAARGEDGKITALEACF